MASPRAAVSRSLRSIPCAAWRAANFFFSVAVRATLSQYASGIRLPNMNGDALPFISRSLRPEDVEPTLNTGGRTKPPPARRIDRARGPFPGQERHGGRCVANDAGIALEHGDLGRAQAFFPLPPSFHDEALLRSATISSIVQTRPTRTLIVQKAIFRKTAHGRQNVPTGVPSV